MSLRQYQTDAICSIVTAEKEGCINQLIVLPCGTGKTVVASNLPSALGLSNWQTQLFLVHRDELALQACEEFREANPSLSVGLEKAGARIEGHEDIIVASVQTLARSTERLAKLNATNPRIVVVDEGHHLPANSWSKVLEDLHCLKGSPHRDPGRLFLTITATPRRADGVALEKFCDKIVFHRSSRRMIEEKWLSEPIAYRVSSGEDLDGVATRAGDFAVHQLEEAVNTPSRNALIVKKYLEFGAGLPFICFSVDIQHSEDIAATFKYHGISCEALSGDTPTLRRRELVEEHKRGNLTGLVSCGVLVEGFNSPIATVGLMARPTQSGLLYCLDSETEILSSTGWKSMGQLAIGDIVAAPDPETFTVNWVPVEHVVQRQLCPCCETMLSLKSVRADIRVTNAHRMIYRTKKTRPWRIGPASELLNIRSQFQLPACGTSGYPESPIQDDELKFLGWFMTDGHFNPLNNQITICQSERYPDNLLEIKRVLKSCGFKYGEILQTESPYGDGYLPRHVFTISKGLPRGRDKDLSGWARLEPYVDKEYPESLFAISDRQFSVLLEAIHLGDGAKFLNQTWTRRSYHISTGNLRFAERLQACAVTHGWACNIGMQTNGRKNPIYYVHMKARSASHIGGVGTSDRATIHDEGFSSETVWCVGNRVGTLITRRGGKAIVMGNCQMAGRVLRPYPAPEAAATHVGYRKKNAILIDFCGLTSKFRLYTASTLFGLSPQFDMKGKSITKTLEHLESLEKSNPTLDISAYAGLEDVEAACTQVDLWKPSPIPKLAKSCSAFLWIQESEDVCRLSIPGMNIYLKVDHLGQYEVSRHIDGKVDSVFVFTEAEDGFALADSLVPDDVVPLVRANARWRKQEPTEAQCVYAWRMDPIIHKRFSSGDAFHRYARYKYQTNSAFSKGAISQRIELCKRGKEKAARTT